jgi:hypothetical protein
MPIPVVCSCSAKLKVGDHLNGKHIKCPKCGSVIPVGASNGTGHAPAPAAAPAARPRTPAPPAPDAVLAENGLSAEERERLKGALASGERLVWAGKPVVRWAFIRAWGIGAGLLFTTVVLVVILVLTSKDGLLTGAGGMLIFVGLLLAAFGFTVAGVAWPYLQRWYATRVVYAVTTRRALSWNPNYFGKVSLSEYEPEDIAKLYRTDITPGPDGVGNIIFGVTARRKKTREGVEITYRRYGFFLLRGAADVERILRETLVDPYLDALYE